MAHNIKNLLHNFLENENNWKLTLLRHWPHIIGDLRTKVCLEKIHKETLVLGVYDSCWLQELYLLSPILLKKINEKLENVHIKKLRFKQTGKKHIKEKKSTTTKKIVNKKITLTDNEKETLKNIKDPDLESALRKFLIRCYQDRK